MTQLLERPTLTPRGKVRRGLTTVFVVIGIAGAATLGAGTWFHDQPGNDQPLIVHGVQSR